MLYLVVSWCQILEQFHPYQLWINWLQQLGRVHLIVTIGGVDDGGFAVRLVLVDRVNEPFELCRECGPLGLVPLELVVVFEVDEDDGGDDEADPDEEERTDGRADDDGQRDARALRPLRPRAVVQLLFFRMGLWSLTH